MPMSAEFARRLDAVLESAADFFGTPFHVYDETGIRETCAAFDTAFRATPYREYFAVKGMPNPTMLRLLHQQGLGFDCSSPPELELADQAGAVGHDICFTSNNTSDAELRQALDMGALVTVDDETVLAKLLRLDRPMPETLAFRVHGSAVTGITGESRLGTAESSKFGIPADRLSAVGEPARRTGVCAFGLHLMSGSGLMSADPFLRSLDTLLEQAERLHTALGVTVSFVNLGGGIGIPYQPGEPEFDLSGLGREIVARLAGWEQRTRRPRPRLLFECGRYVTGPHGVLVTRVLNRMSKAREYVGVDAGMSALMRPAIYSAYHHVNVPRGENRPVEVVDVVGSMCENLDKFAQHRTLPRVGEGDLLVIHDTGAHALSMGWTYNGRLRPQELLLRADGSVERIRRAEESRDYFATLQFTPKRLEPVTELAGAR